ncbi:hypothetical protein JR316_0008697 [Psilocybe cubensis]|uniref:Uncharacterized protein n=2 Tax=Psilocybe cubensis TaxID=181762 RepID=A0A8H7XVN4_PSICU|nr:hypothetical protein JR316_0008697 [Psilocybe cubensis]KAH9478244.1 hypothetical protein JR316_0008697 [Psilocybe cubensis]
MTYQGAAQVKFLATLRDNPQLATLVRVYHIPTHDVSDGSLSWQLVLCCIKQMTNLKELVYLSLFAKSENPFPQVSEGEEIPFQLERFVWAVEGRHRQDGVTQFLRTQHKLKFLQLSCQLNQNIPSDIVPDLHTLDGDVDLICAALPGRSISKLYWREYPWRAHRPWSYFNILFHASQLEELSGIRGLSISMETLSRLFSSQLQNGLRRLQNVEVLEICTNQAMSNLINITKKFPCLKRFIIRPDVSKVPFPYPTVVEKIYRSEEIQSEVAALFKASPSLVYVDIWVGDLLFKRWEVNVLVPELVIVPVEKMLE